MNRDQLVKEYKAFFVESQAGQHFVAELNRLIDKAHRDSEDNPDMSRDYTQRAKGVRDVLTHIIATGTEIKRGRTMQ